MGILQEKEIISLLFNTVIFLTLLLSPEDTLAQFVDSGDKTAFPVEDKSPENGQSDPVEVELSPSIPPQSQENPIILEKAEGRLPFDDTSSQKGIGDAFSQDHRDRFQSKNEKVNKDQSSN